MPVAGDTLRYSYALAIDASTVITTTGPNITWNFDTLTPISQAVDAYKHALQVSPAYAIISLSAYGYKIADSLPGASTLPLSISELYNFFNKKTNPSRFVAEAFAAKVAGTPVPVNYSDEDEIYFFPLDYGDEDSSTYRLSHSFASIGSFVQEGNRKTTVDAHGTITTPHFTTPQSCIRVRSVLNEVDTFTFGTTVTPISRTQVDYKWLVQGEHYPALWITTTVVGGQEVMNAIRFRDNYRTSLGVADIASSFHELTAFPNPATSDNVTLNIPASWKQYSVEVFDAAGRLSLSVQNSPKLNVSNLANGHYIVRVTSGDHIGYVRMVK